MLNENYQFGTEAFCLDREAPFWQRGTLTEGGSALLKRKKLTIIFEYFHLKVTLSKFEILENADHRWITCLPFIEKPHHWTTILLELQGQIIDIKLSVMKATG
jgi:hypothetical protein